MRLLTFLKSDSGAVTVDWVVLTAGTTGLGLATMAVISGGMQNISGDMSGTIGGITISDRFAAAFQAVQLAAMDFSGGNAGGWTGASVSNVGGMLGELLRIGPNGLAELTLDVPAGASEAVFTFSLIGGDSLDNESATIMINGQPVTIGTGDHGFISWANANVPGVTVETNVLSQGTELGGSTNDNWLESVTNVTITVQNPGNSVTLGVASSTNQSINDEWFGIDNFTANAN
jgi:hypothetical protein